MSTDAGLKIYFCDEILPSVLIQKLIQGGWGLDLDGSRSLFSQKKFVDGDWETLEGKDTSYLLKWAKATEKKCDDIGFVMVHQLSGIGGATQMGADRKMLYWGISTNIPRVLGGRVLVDFSTCMCILLDATDLKSLDIDRIEAYAQY